MKPGKLLEFGLAAGFFFAGFVVFLAAMGHAPGAAPLDRRRWSWQNRRTAWARGPWALPSLGAATRERWDGERRSPFCFCGGPGLSFGGTGALAHGRRQAPPTLTGEDRAALEGA